MTNANSGRTANCFPSGGTEYVPAIHLLPIAEEVSRIGEDPEKILGRLMLPFRLEDIARGGVAVISRHQFILIFREYLTAISHSVFRERAVFREHALSPMNCAVLDMLCYCVITCGSLREVMDRAIQFSTLMGERSAFLSINEGEVETVFSIKSPRVFDSVSAILTDLVGLSFHYRLFGWLIGEPLPIRGFGVVYSNKTFDEEALANIFRQPVHFNASCNHFRFPTPYLEKPIVRKHQELTDLIGLFPVDITGEQPDSPSLSEAVELLISNRLTNSQSIPALAELAGVFNLSTTTFKRRLEAENCSFTAIKKRCLLRAATDMLASSRRTKISDVGDRLGFSDVRAFRRAFVRWTGMTPDGYRSNSRMQGPNVPTGIGRVSRSGFSDRDIARPVIAGGRGTLHN